MFIQFPDFLENIKIFLEKKNLIDMEKPSKPSHQDNHSI